ncbi:MAG: T9SS type A sorting domain-containing protein [Chitinophagaceae bacterium]
MRPYLIVSVLICLSFSFSFGQSVSSSKQIGFSEYPGNVRGYVSDKDGNKYMLVNFIGTFSPDSSVTYSGKGEGDVLLIKYNPDHTVNWARNLGTEYSEFSSNLSPDNNALYYDSIRNELLLLTNITFPQKQDMVQYAGTTVQFPQPQQTAILMTKIAADGSTRWIRHLSHMPMSILPGKDRIDLFFSSLFSPTSTGTLIQIGSTTINVPILPSQQFTYALVYASLSQNGAVLVTKKMQALNQSTFNTNNLIAAKDRFIMSMTIDGDSVILNDQKVRFTENKYSNRYIFAIDTAFENIVASPLPNISFSPQFYIEETDRIYCKGVFPNASTYFIGGGNVPANNEQILFGLNRNLVLQETHRIAPLYVGLNYEIRRNTLSIGPIMRFGDSLYFTGCITGGNEFADANVTPDNITTRVFFNYAKTLDLNGQSNAFLGHTNLQLQQPELHWIGEMESPLSNGQIFLHQLHVTRDKKVIEFIPGDTKGTKRWQYDLTQKALTAKDTINTLDLLDPTQYIEANKDGSYIIAGTSLGKLKIDDELNIKMRPRKAGIYFAGISPTQQTSWISRIEGSYEVVSLQQFRRNNGLYYFHARLTGALNRQNYIKAGATIIQTGSSQNVHILGYLNNKGEITIKYHPGNQLLDISGASLIEFSFNEHSGEVNAMMHSRELTKIGFFMNKSYSADISDVIVRFDSLLNYKDSRGLRIVSTPTKIGGYNLFQFLSMAGSGNKMFISGKSLPRQPNEQISLETFKGNTLLQKFPLDTLTFDDIRLALIRFHWEEGIKWSKKTNRTSGTTMVTVGNIQVKEGELEYMNNKLYMYFKLPNVLINSTYYWDNHLVSKQTTIPSSADRTESLVCLDTMGNLQSKLPLYGSQSAKSLKKKDGHNTLILSMFFSNPVKILDQTYTSAGFADALGLIIDSALNIKKRIHLHSTAQELLQDFDFTPDTTILLAAHIQKETNIALQRTSNSTVKEEDLQEQSVIITYRSTMITPVPDTRLSSLLLYPNPSKAGFYTDLGASQAGAYNIVVFDMLGRAAFTKKINWVQGSPIPVQLPGTIRKGMYFVQVKTENGKNIHTTKLLIE